MAEAPAPSLKDRIAALNLNQVASAPPTSPPPSYDQAVQRPRAPPPPLPPKRNKTTNNPPLQSNAPASAPRRIGNQPVAPPPIPPTSRDTADSPEVRPKLPPRTSTQKSLEPPKLPPRRPSSQQRDDSRRGSAESISTVASGTSSISGLSLSRTNTSTLSNGAPRIRAPEYNPATLPPLPPKRMKEPEKQPPKTPLRPAKSTSNLQQNGQNGERRSLPPPDPPSRPPLPSQNGTNNLEVKPPPRRSALSWGMNKATEEAPTLLSNRPSSTSSASPPPVPLSSRPNLAALQASKPNVNGAASTSCLKCRDFSAPDAHAARFPRQSIPSNDINWLGQQLTSPFPSLTDKARALFTWLHHNIEYDVHSFFNNCVKPSTPASTLSSGLAVCEGYAGLFTALATASRLESMVVGGHGKGYSYASLKPGDPVPPFFSTHAWNAVKIDNGEWKLIDACWGAGAVQGKGQPYIKRFAPECFTMDNIEFGLKHFPTDRSLFFRADGRTPTWEEYMLADAGEEKLQVYGGCQQEYSISEQSFQPRGKKVPVRGHEPTIRFQFEKVCRHWDHERNGSGKPFLKCLEIGGRDRRNGQKLPFQTDGYFSWVDVPRAEMGAPGQQVKIIAITQINGKECRGLTAREFEEKNGRCGMSWSYVAAWDLV